MKLIKLIWKMPKAEAIPLYFMLAMGFFLIISTITKMFQPNYFSLLMQGDSKEFADFVINLLIIGINLQIVISSVTQFLDQNLITSLFSFKNTQDEYIALLKKHNEEAGVHIEDLTTRLTAEIKENQKLKTIINEALHGKK